jgi:tetratricopeptide (TPR) repeat protein
MAAAAGLLRRATALPSPSAQDRVEALVGLGRAFRELAALGDARETLAAALVAAQEAGDERLEGHAAVEQQFLALFGGADLDLDEMARVAAAAAATFERCGDDLGLTRALGLAAWVHWGRSRIGEMEEVLERALGHAERAGVRRELLLLLGARARAALVGPAPVEQAVRRCEEILASADGDRTTDAVVSIVLGCLNAMRGRFGDARALAERSKAVFRDHGRNHPLAAVHAYAATVEELAGDAAAAERELRTAYALFTEAGDRTQAGAAAGLLARLLAQQGRVDEADELAGLSERDAPDVEAQVVWREARAQVHAAAGAADDARRLAREALALADATDYLDLRGRARMTLVRVLAAEGAATGAAEALAEAERLFAAKGNVVATARARAAMELVPD